ncbi:Uncharacterised protein [Chryseobacterium nakagawai]|nr:Uncharacterised protein [Chryseobacterium nakagawai]
MAISWPQKITTVFHPIMRYFGDEYNQYQFFNKKRKKHRTNTIDAAESVD